MKNVVRLAMVDPSDSTRNSLKNLLLGIDSVWLEAECSRYEFFRDVLVQTQPDMALVVLDSDQTKALSLVHRIGQELPSCQIVVVSSSQEGSVILQAMRSGAKEFLTFPLKLDDFLAALNRIKQSLSGGDGVARSTQVISIAGVSGGIGCTSLAINVACSLAQQERNSVAIIDLDMALGDADVWLDIIPDYTIQDVAENITRLDYALLKRSLTRHDCGAFLLPRPVLMQDTTPISPDELRRVLALLKATFSHLVLDVSKSYTPLDMAALSASDTILLVTQLDLASLRNVVRLVQFFDTHDGISDKVKIIVNRVGLEDTQISLNKALETIGRECFWQIPNEYQTMVESRNNGVPVIQLAPRSKLTKAIEQLANAVDMLGRGEQPTMQDVTGAQQPAQQKKSKSLFSFLKTGAK